MNRSLLLAMSVAACCAGPVQGRGEILGTAQSRNGAVTLDSNIIDTTCIPAPGTAATCAGLAGGLFIRRRKGAHTICP